MILNAKQIADYTAATVVVEPMDSSRLATSITWDSREVAPDGVYVALPGEKVDGHNFVEDALYAGAIVILVMRPIDTQVQVLAREMGAAILEVSSTFSALTDLAQYWRKHLHARVIALTGSTGKTTTKNLTRDVLAGAGQTVATKGNQNNELGVPRTLLEADPNTEFLVVEMGMRGFNQLSSLCEFVKPDMALITNTGESHIELLGSRENIARAKAEVIQALPDVTGIALLNHADAHTELIKQITEVEQRHINVVEFDGSGTVDAATPEMPDVYATEIELDSEGRPQFKLHTPQGFLPCSLQLRGLHNVHNACAAAAVGVVCGLSLQRIVKGLERSLPEVGRQEITTNAEGVCVINDAYNANPDSMRASLAMFSAFGVEGKRYAVLGDMGELGDYAQACHEGVGRAVAHSSVDYLICVGKLSQYIAQAAHDEGFPRDKISEVQSCGEALGVLEPILKKGDAVLVKASHSMGLERIVRGLLN